MPSDRSLVNRRRVLLGAAALALLGTAAPACTSSPEPPKVDDLLAQRDLAQKDSEMAAAAANAADRVYAPALTVVAAERASHAKALIEEIARAAGTTTPIATPTSTATSSGTPTLTAPNPPPSLNDVRAALRASADSATQLAAKLSGYRAGLLGSIAASCTASITVPLAATQPGS
jgi:hypothetical protein